MQLDIAIGKARFGLFENAVIEERNTVIDNAACRADGVDEGEHRAAGRRQVLNDEHAGAFRHMAFDLSVAAMAFGFLRQ